MFEGMKYNVHIIGENEVAEIDERAMIESGPAFLEMAMNIPHDHFIIYKENLPETFFDLKTGLAGDILQKVSNYRLRIVIVGDFSMYDSKSLRDFIFESNKSGSVGFVGTLEEALKRFQ